MWKFRNESQIHYSSRYVVNHAYDYTQRIKNLIIFLILHMRNILKFILTIHERCAKNKYVIIYIACRQYIR